MLISQGCSSVYLADESEATGYESGTKNPLDSHLIIPLGARLPDAQFFVGRCLANRQVCQELGAPSPVRLGQLRYRSSCSCHRGSFQQTETQ
jgi:hypothetical protein